MKNRNKIVYLFAAASFLHDIGSDMVFSVWPLYVFNVLHANMAVLGFIDGLGDAVVSFSQAISGYYSDKLRKRKIFIWIGYLFGAIARVGYAFSTTWQMLIPFRILDRSGKMRSSPRDAIISDVSTREDRGRNFGILRMMDNSGAVIGILIAMFFINKIGYTTLFIAAAVPSVIAVLLVIFFIKEPQKSATKIFKGIRFSDFDSNFKMYTLLSTLFALGSFSYSFLLIYAQRSGIQTVFIPGFYLLFTFVAAATSFYFGKLSDTLGRKNVLFLSFSFWIIVTCLIIFMKSPVILVIAFIFYGLHKAALNPVQTSIVAELAKKEFTATTLGGFQMIIGLCALPASLIAGLLWDSYGAQAPFYLSLILTIISSILLFFVKEKTVKA